MKDDPKRIAKEVDKFLKTDFGIYFMDHISALYNQRHQEAEQLPTCEGMGLKVAQAKGVKEVIDFILSYKSAYDQKLFEEEPADNA